MNVLYTHKPALRFIGYSAQIRPEEGPVECPKFWETAYTRRFARLWQTHTPETDEERAVWDNQIGMYALCIMNADGSFEYAIAGEYAGGPVPASMKLYDLPESDYAVFTEHGPIPESLQRLNTEVWQQWYPNEGQRYRANGNTTLEIYTGADPTDPDYECGIWIPILGPEKP